MTEETYNTQQLILDISTISDNIKQDINQLKDIINLINIQKEITSYEQEHCKQCNEPCGRSNAEIFNCMMNKKNLKNGNIPEHIKRYPKEYLERDLKEITADLEENKKRLTEIMEKIEKGISHS